MVRHFVRQNTGYGLMGVEGCRLVVDQEQALAIKDRPRVLHRPGFKIGRREDIQLSKGVFNRKILIVVMQDMGSSLQGKTALFLLVRRGADANGNAIRPALDTREIPHRHGHQIARHPGRGGEFKRVLGVPGTRGIVQNDAIGNRRIPLVHDQADAEGRLHGGFVKAREGPASVAGFKLRDRVFPAIRVGQVEAAQLVIELARENNVNFGGPGSKDLPDRQCRHLAFGIEADLGGLTNPRGGDGDLLEANFRRIQGDGRNRMQHLYLDGFVSGEGRLGKVRGKPKLVVFGRHRVRKALKLGHPAAPEGRHRPQEKQCPPSFGDAGE